MRAEASTFRGRVGNEGIWRQVDFLTCVQPERIHFGRLEGRDMQHWTQACSALVVWAPLLGWGVLLYPVVGWSAQGEFWSLGRDHRCPLLLSRFHLHSLHVHALQHHYCSLRLLPLPLHPHPHLRHLHHLHPFPVNPFNLVTWASYGIPKPVTRTSSTGRLTSLVFE